MFMRLQSSIKPRISGNLYNCALNCALPHLLTSIEQIARNGNIAYQDAYVLLKNKFAHWYGVSLTWQGFDLLLSKFTFNEIELIMAPVLRLFIAEKAQDGEREKYTRYY